MAEEKLNTIEDTRNKFASPRNKGINYTVIDDRICPRNKGAVAFFDLLLDGSIYHLIQGIN
jgi:hypothetical protein